MPSLVFLNCYELTVLNLQLLNWGILIGIVEIW
jgi:hypothetical protein